MSRILVTAFEPFGGDSVNPTQLVLEALPDHIAGARVEKLLLPVEFRRAAEMALEAASLICPDCVICLGQAGGRGAVTPELYGRNLMNARIPDNAGYQPAGLPIVKGGPDELMSRLPVWRIIAHIRREGLPAEISFSAGEYVCNSLLYSVLYGLHESVRAGFIHVPFIRGQVEGVPGREKKPYMELDDIKRAVCLAIEAAVK